MQKPAVRLTPGIRSARIPLPPTMSPAWTAADLAPAPGTRPDGAGSGPQAPGAPVDFAAFHDAIIARGGALARRSYEAWLARAERDARYGDVQSFVHDLKHEALFALRLDEVERVTLHPDPAVRTGHALGDIRPAADCIREVDDFDTPWALQYLLHGLLERKGALPRWEDFDRFLRNAARARYYGPFTERFGYGARTEAEIHRFERALQWRTGNAYYSFLREVDLLTRLRVEHGLPVRYHVLADAQFKIDLWCDNVLVAVFIKNPRYRQGASGRKERVQDRMDVAAFRTLELELDAPTRFGRPSLVTRADVERAARAIRAALTTN